MIGLFDSGIGGLTIAQELIKQLPGYSYVYLADTAHAPYGNKTREQIVELTKIGVADLFEQGAILVVLACNTASSAALRELQQEWLPGAYPDRKLLGIVVPTVEQITGAPWRHVTPITTPISEDVFTVGVLATPVTVQTKAYTHEIQRRNQSIQVVEQACEGLAEAIDMENSETISFLIHEYTKQLLEKSSEIRAVLLGCTHYELVSAEIAKTLPQNVRLYHQPTIVAQSLKTYLLRHPDLDKRLSKHSERHFFASGGTPAQTLGVAWEALT